MVVQVLKQAVLCRTTNFDLLEANGWQTLCEDIAEDFPHLTLAELSGIIKDGYKGKLDKYKSLPLNYTRIYQWVASQAPKQASAWASKFPELMEWAKMTGTDQALFKVLSTYAGEGHVNMGIVKTWIREAIGLRYTPGPDWCNKATHGDINALLGRFAEKYPEFHRVHCATMI